MTSKRVHFIRHAQSEHNAPAIDAADEDMLRRDPALRDAPLTALGQSQTCIAVEGHGTFLHRLTGTVFANAQRVERRFEPRRLCFHAADDLIGFYLCRRFRVAC